MRDADYGGTLVSLPLSDLERDRSCRPLVILPQAKTEALLCEEIRNTVGVEIRFSCEMTGFVQDSYGVDVVCRRLGHEERVRAKYVVGCDGERSIVRTHIHGSLRGGDTRRASPWPMSVCPAVKASIFPG